MILWNKYWYIISKALSAENTLSYSHSPDATQYEFERSSHVTLNTKFTLLADNIDEISCFCNKSLYAERQHDSRTFVTCNVFYPLILIVFKADLHEHIYHLLTVC